jgi:hypothetical protein
MRSTRRIASYGTAPMFTVALLWGCAQGSGVDVTSGVDPTLPELDASWSPSPNPPSEKLPAKEKADSGSGEQPPASSDDEEEEEDPPPTAVAPDAGGFTTNPPAGTKPTQGEVLITEVMYDPTSNEPATEWIELHNKASGTRTLSGLTIVDGGDRTHVIGAGVTIAAGAYVVLVRSQSAAVAAKVPSGAIVYEYGAGLPSNAGVQLANAGTGGVWLRDGSTTIAQADYGGWYSQSGGSSIQLKTLTYPASGQSSNWCVSFSPWTTGSDKGTPGAPSDCP